MRRRHHHRPLIVTAAAAKTHAALLKSGVAAATPWNQLLTAYSLSPLGLAAARQVFDDIPRPDAVSWNALLASHVAAGAHAPAWRLLRAMHARSLAADSFALGSALRSAAAARRPSFGAQLHSLLVKSGLDCNIFTGSALLDMYAKLGRLQDARLVFDRMPARNTVSWNALITGYAEAGNVFTALELFFGMERAGLLPDEATFAALLAAIKGPGYCFVLRQLHGKIVKYGPSLGLIVWNAAITAYSLCGAFVDARRIFDEMEDDVRDLVSWNSMLAAHSYHGMVDDAMRLFARMMRESDSELDVYSFTSLISACSEHRHDDHRGRVIHGLVIKKGFEGVTPVCNALIAMYIRSNENGMMEDAWKCFIGLAAKDNVSWNSMLTGYSQHGLAAEALRFFGSMRSVDLPIDHYAFSAALRSCSDLAVLQLGRQIHGSVLQSGFSSNDFLSSSLIFMYAKSGTVADARKCFDEADKSSSVPWNSMMFGYAQHGQAQTVLDLFKRMQDLKVPLDHITFVSLITACSHAGLVDQGSRFLETMESEHGIVLRMEHYACGVDLYGRAGRLDKAKVLIESMPFEPDAMVWMTLLGACRIHGNMELASNVASHLLMAEPSEHSTYVLLSSLYSGIGMWGNRAMMQRVMKQRGLSKVPGWSWIEVKNEVHSFNAEDRSHPKSEEIYEMLSVFLEEAGMLACDEDDELPYVEFG